MGLRNKEVNMKETEKMSADLARVRAELKAKLETAMLMSKLMRMSKESL
jgi:hypothetical protein